MDARDFKDAMSAAGKAFADGLAANEETEREKGVARAVAELRSDALRRVKSDLDAQRQHNRAQVLEAVAKYCSDARADALDDLKNDRRMPRTINHLERYNALLGMDDRGEVLRRLDQTIARAESILDEVEEIDVDAALGEAAIAFAANVRRLDGIVIANAEGQVRDETAMPPKTPGTKKAASDEEFEKAIEDAFLGAFGSVSDVEELQAAIVADQDARIEKLVSQVEESVLAAEKTAKEVLYTGAEAVAGNILSIPAKPAFDGSAVLAAELDVEKVLELCAEVRKSFETFSQVVQDNGLFAAFASEGSFGACRGWRFGLWWDDFYYELSEYDGEIPGRNPVHDIPSDIEEDEGGDTLERSIERMRGFNKKRYWGMLDDEFDGHVEAFWYGFKKLMESVNGLYRMNPSAFNEYCNELAEDAKRATLEAGAASMDAHQADEFCKDVESRMKAVLKRRRRD